MGSNFLMGIILLYQIIAQALQKEIAMLYCRCYLPQIVMEDVGYSSPLIEGRQRRFPKVKVFVILLLVLIVIIPFIIGGFYVASSLSPKPVTPTPVPTSVAFPTDTPTPMATPTPTSPPTPTPKGQTLDVKTGLDRTKLTIIVENGSGIVGAANKAAQILKTAGYVVTGTRNADAYDYVDVTISIKADKAGYVSLLKQDLEGEYTIADTRTNLSASVTADAIVIIGK